MLSPVERSGDIVQKGIELLPRQAQEGRFSCGRLFGDASDNGVRYLILDRGERRLQGHSAGSLKVR